MTIKLIRRSVINKVVFVKDDSGIQVGIAFASTISDADVVSRLKDISLSNFLTTGNEEARIARMSDIKIIYQV